MGQNTEDLEKVIARRKKEAEDRRISYKIKTIVDIIGYAGEHHSTETIGSTGIYTTTRSGSYNDAEFSIQYRSEWSESSDGGGGGCYERSIEYNKSRVFSENSVTLEVYTPGAWEESFDRLYDKAHVKEEKDKEEKLERQKKIERESKDEAIQKMRKNFGL